MKCIQLKKTQREHQWKQFSREHQDEQAGSHWALDWRRVWRRSGERHTACNIIQRDQCGSWSVMFWEAIAIKGHTALSDLNPIEHIQVWDEIFSSRLMKSICRHCREVIQARGGHTYSHHFHLSRRSLISQNSQSPFMLSRTPRFSIQSTVRLIKIFNWSFSLVDIWEALLFFAIK